MAGTITTEKGIPVGNVYNKYTTSNPIARHLMQNFLSNVLELVQISGADDVHEVGCGEGYLTEMIAQLGIAHIRGSDMSLKMIADAQTRTAGSGIQFYQKSIYELDSDDSARLIVCCEVLEHLNDPEAALKCLAELNSEFYIFSVPREPVWRALNMIRGKYLKDIGNTPGHLQHWSANSFKKMITNYFDIQEVRTPLPWTMILCLKIPR